MEDTAVTVLLCTRNGARYLPEQLDSYLAQGGADWALWVSDDGSSDDSWAILEAFRAAHPEREIRLFHGPCRGGTANFMSLICHPELPTHRPVALSDQDDVWLPHRLSRALDRLAGLPGERPVLYGSKTLVTDAELGQRRLSRKRLPPTMFRNAIVQNVVAGNTMVLNPAAVALVRRAAARDPGQGAAIPHHDWWFYALLTGAGAEVVLDEEPGLLYRQHGDNCMGDARGRGARWRRMRVVLQGEYGAWVQANLAALERVSDLLTPEARALHADFTAALRGNRWRRLWIMARGGIRRETPLGTAALYVAAWLGRVSPSRRGRG